MIEMARTTEHRDHDHLASVSGLVVIVAPLSGPAAIGPSTGEPRRTLVLATVRGL